MSELKFKAAFEAHHVDVGLSTEVPICYGDVVEKYQLVYSRASVTSMRGTLEFQFGSTTGKLRMPWDQARMKCLLMVAQLPTEALAEAQSELEELRQHYLDIESANRSLPPPRTPELISARVLGGE